MIVHQVVLRHSRCAVRRSAPCQPPTPSTRSVPSAPLRPSIFPMPNSWALPNRPRRPSPAYRQFLSEVLASHVVPKARYGSHMNTHQPCFPSHLPHAAPAYKQLTPDMPTQNRTVQNSTQAASTAVAAGGLRLIKWVAIAFVALVLLNRPYCRRGCVGISHPNALTPLGRALCVQEYIDGRPGRSQAQ